MEAKFVIRILDKEGNLLAWQTEMAVAHPQGNGHACPFWPKTGVQGTTPFVVERAGLAARTSVHWCDLDLARVNDILEPLQVEPLQTLNFKWFEPIWLVAGMKGVPLPAVTVRQAVTIAVPTGSLAAAGTS